MFYRAYHWQNICAWQVLSCTECFKGTFIFVSLKDLKKGLVWRRWAGGAVEPWSVKLNLWSHQPLPSTALETSQK